MTKVRGVLFLASASCFVYGAWKLWRVGIPNLFAAAQWLIAGVILHDGVIAPVVVVLGVAVARLLPRWSQAPVVVAGVVLGTTTLLAIPVLGRFGARPDNPSLLDRPYITGWLLLCAVTIAAASTAALIRRSKDRSRQGLEHPVATTNATKPV